MTRENLLGYLLGALDAHEHDEVRRQLEGDPQLREELRLLDARVAPLSCCRHQPPPPPDLAERTCALVGQHVAASQSPQLHGVGPVQTRTTGWGDERGATSRDRLRWSMADFAVAAGVCLAAAMLFFPTISHSRDQARRLACQNNLRLTGHALHEYAQLARGFYPSSEPFAGRYAMELVDAGMMNDPSQLRCPSVQQASPMTLPTALASLGDWQRAAGPRRLQIQREASPDYAYRLGWLSQGVYQGVKDNGQADSPILADSLDLSTIPGDRSADVSGRHGGGGRNVWFADGHVQFVNGCTLGNCPQTEDNIYLNRLGIPAAGSDPEDAVLGHSELTPIPIGYPYSRSR